MGAIGEWHATFKAVFNREPYTKEEFFTWVKTQKYIERHGINGRIKRYPSSHINTLQALQLMTTPSFNDRHPKGC